MNKRDQEDSLQNRKRGAERGQTGLGKTHVDYWYSKLLKRRYPGRDGTEVEVPYWQIRLKHLGRAMYFNLQMANAVEGAVKARDIYRFLRVKWLGLYDCKIQTTDRKARGPYGRGVCGSFSRTSRVG